MRNEFFESIEADELQEIDGGSITLGGILLSAVVGAAVCIVVDVGNEALKNQTGKNVQEWATYGLGYAADKIGQGLENLGMALQ